MFKLLPILLILTVRLNGLEEKHYHEDDSENEDHYEDSDSHEYQENESNSSEYYDNSNSTEYHEDSNPDMESDGHYEESSILSMENNEPTTESPRILKKRADLIISGPVMNNGTKIDWNVEYLNQTSRAFLNLNHTVCSFGLPAPMIKVGCKVLSARQGSTVVDAEVIVVAPENTVAQNIYDAIKAASPELNSSEITLVSSSETYGYPPLIPILKSKKEKSNLFVTWSNEYDNITSVVFRDEKTGKKVSNIAKKTAVLPVSDKSYKFSVYAQNMFGVSDKVILTNEKNFSVGAIILVVIGIILIALVILLLIVCCLSIYWARRKSYPRYVPQNYQKRVNSIVYRNKVITIEDKRAEYDSYNQYSQPPSY